MTSKVNLDITIYESSTVCIFISIRSFTPFIILLFRLEKRHEFIFRILYCNSKQLFCFPEMLKHSRGRYTEDQVARCAQMGGAFGQQIDRLFTLAGLGQFDTREVRARPNWYHEDIRTFCDEYQESALLDYLPGRQPEGFETFTFNRHIKQPWKMGQKLKTLSQKMDTRKEIRRRPIE